MISWQITEPEVIEQSSNKENIDSVDSFKVKIKKVLLTQADFDAFLGETSKDYPVTPGSFAVGEVVEMGDQNNFYGIKILDKVYLNPAAQNANTEDFASLNSVEYSSNFYDGFLKDFAVVKSNELFALPESVSMDDAIFIQHLSLSIAVIDKLNIQKGEHVVIIGGNTLGNIIAQLINYYQGVSVIVDGNEENLQTAKNCGIYYTYKSTTSLEKEIFEITGGRMAHKVIYVTDSGLNSDVALRLAGNSSSVAFTGLGKTHLKFSVNLAMQKQLDVSFVSDNFSNTEASINLIANKAINLSNFNIKNIKFGDVKKVFKDASQVDDYENTILVNIE